MIHWLTSTYIGKLFATFFLSMLPVGELRTGLPYGIVCGLKPWEAYITAVLGNMLPIPFVLLLLNIIMEWMKKQQNFLGDIADWLERKAYRNSAPIEKYKAMGLLVLVAIPLPGTGAWTGALVAVVLGIKNKKAFPIIFLGVAIAGIIMLMLSLVFKQAF